jgi:parallel beta-helix repeat protein
MRKLASFHPNLGLATGWALTLAFAAASIVAVSGPGAAAGAQVSCGDTITTDTTLHQDLIDCPNNGIVIGADGVTLDLNGHLVDGDGTPAAGCDPRAEVCDAGVVGEGYDGITVMDGRVREFGIGVLVGGTSAAEPVRDNRILGVSSARNEFAGIGILSSVRSLVRNSSGNGSIARDGGSGIFLFDSHRARILDNAFRNNGDLGIFVGKSTHNLIKGNLIPRNHESGITMDHADRNQVRGNRFVRNRESVLVGPGSRNVIARNRVSRTLAGIAIEKGDGNVVARNVVVRPRRVGIYLAILHPPIGGANNVVRGNVVRGSGGVGFLVREEDQHSLLKGNVAKGAKDDGFLVRSRSTKLTSNRAVRNGDLGIEAVRGVIDGGGNIARHNEDPRQCTNIVCG